MPAWCHRCDRLFNGQRALDQHRRDSPHHSLCLECDFDGTTWEDLIDHCLESACRTVCRGCEDGDGALWITGSDDYWQHVADENVCTACEEHFDTPVHLRQHKMDHHPRNIDCYRCYDTFNTYGGMILHLESGCCDEHVDEIELNRTAAECPMWSFFVDNQWREHLLRFHDLRSIFAYRVFPFMCPTCDTPFSKLSALFQHVESPNCTQSLERGAIGILRGFLQDEYEL